VNPAGDVDPGAIGRWDPEIGRSGVEDDFEILGRSADGDRSVVLGVFKVGDGNVGGISLRVTEVDGRVDTG